MRETGIYNLIGHYKKYWLTILIMGIAGFIIGLIYNSFIQVPKYKSSATLIIVKSDDATSKNSTLINNYIRLFKSRKVLEPTIKDLKLNSSYDNLASSIEATNDTDTEVVKLAVTSESAKTSQETLNHAISLFKDEAKRLYKKDNIQIVDSASIENKPYNVNAGQQLLISTGIGLLMPLIVIFFIYDVNFNENKDGDNLDKKESSNDQISLGSNPEPNKPLNDSSNQITEAYNQNVETKIEELDLTRSNKESNEIQPRIEPITKQHEPIITPRKQITIPPTQPVSIIRSFTVPDRRG